MADLVYADFDYFPSGVTIQALNDLVTAIDGEGSLLIDRDGGASPSLNAAPLTPDVRQGVSTGILRAAFRADTLNSSSQGFGLLCMQSQRDLTTSGTAYALHWQPLAQLVRLLRIGNGLQNAGSITTLAFALVDAGTGGALQLAWELAADLTTMDLMGWWGNATDFTDLTQVVSVTLTTPLTSHVTEGPYYTDGGAGSDFAVYVDTLSLQGPP